MPAPPPPVPQLPPRPINLSRPEDLAALHRFEAEREYDAFMAHESYHGLTHEQAKRLHVQGGRVVSTVSFYHTSAGDMLVVMP